jgi:hypothetical protein
MADMPDTAAGRKRQIDCFRYSQSGCEHACKWLVAGVRRFHKRKAGFATFKVPKAARIGARCGQSRSRAFAPAFRRRSLETRRDTALVALTGTIGGARGQRFRGLTAIGFGQSTARFDADAASRKAALCARRVDGILRRNRNNSKSPE